jgi:O-antigen/teichoic acid export membrane protein
MGLIQFLQKKIQKYPAAKSIGVYTFINFFTKGVSFLLLIIYTQPRFITPAENGLLNLFGSSILFLMPFLSMGILLSTGTDFYKMEKKAFSSFFTSTMLLPVSVLLLSGIAFFVCRHWLGNVYGFPLSFALLIPLITFLTYINEQLTTLMRMNNELRKFAGTGLAKIVLEFGLSVVLVVFFAMRWEGRLTGIVVSYVLLGIYAFWYFYKKGYLSGAFRWEYIKAELIFAVPTLAMQVSIFSLNTADKFMLAHFSDSNEVVGIYGVTGTFVTVIIIFCSAYLAYLFPSLYQLLAAPVVDYKKIKKAFLNYLVIMTGVAILVTIAIPVVYLTVINSKYHAALDYYYLLTLGALVWSISYYFYAFLLFYKQKRKLLALAIFTIVTSLSCVYFFTSRYGQTGAALGVLIGYFFNFAGTCFFAREHIKKMFQNN